MPPKTTGYKWEGLACLLCFTLVALIFYFSRRSPLLLALFFLLGFIGSCFGLSYLRTWNKIYRNILLGILFIGALSFYLIMLFPFGRR